MTKTTYDPFTRGIHPVGVKSEIWTDTARDDRSLPVEIYYPATKAYEGQDLDRNTQDTFEVELMGESGVKHQLAVRGAEAEPGDWPIILFAHGYAGDRRESTFLCTHVASHGYRVVSADHIGSTFKEVMALMEANYDRNVSLEYMTTDRYGDIPFLLDGAERFFGTKIESAGMIGVSMGGWTALIAPATDKRIKAIAPLCPVGGEGPIFMNAPNPLSENISFDWKSPTPVFMMLGDRDSWLPLYGTLGLLARCPVPMSDKRAVILHKADHNHFVDDVEASHNWFREITRSLKTIDQLPGAPPWAAMAELIYPYEKLTKEDQAHTILRGLVTVHMDSYMKGLEEALAMDDAAVLIALKQRDLHAFVLRV